MNGNTTHGNTPPTDKHIEDLLSRMTLEEKASLTVGRDVWTTMPIERLGIPSVWMSDGPTGLRKARAGDDMSVGRNVPATCFPTESALGSSWDVDLVHEVAAAIAAEAQAENVQVVLGPGVNLKRSPRCGRNFEYFSEDPILSGELAVAFISGLQDNGVGASIKHLVANESETGRMFADSIVDERTLRELYLRPFEIAIAKADPWTVMEAYNQLNGLHCAENGWLLRDLVANEWGYRGIIVSDWFAVNDRAAGVEAGLHLQMPFAPTAPAVAAAVRDGRLTEERLDAVLRPLLAFVLKADAARRPGTIVDLDAHHNLARRAGAESIVLLKNEGALLPLQGDALSNLALVGAFAANPRFQGAGSSQVVPARAVATVHGELLAALGSSGRLTYAPGYADDGSTDEALLQEAREATRQAHIAVVVVGLPGSYEEEGADRAHIDLPPGHNALVEAVAAVQPRTVVVLVGGSAVAMPWLAKVPSVLAAWLGGQASGGAIADLLLGQVNPSGKLAETFPARLEDTSSFLSFPDDGTGRVTFTEALYTGYRWFDARRMAPLFAFGHGLSYTTFDYDDLAIEQAVEGQAAGRHVVTVSLTVRNTGARAGREVVQLYLREQRPLLQRPEKELRAFAKVALTPGEQATVRFTLNARDFAVYDTRAADWVITSADFEVLVGASSSDIRLREHLTLAGFRAHVLPLGRLSPLSDWLAHPVAGQSVRPIIGALLQRFFGEDTEMLNGSEGLLDLARSFVANMPIVKLVMFGALSEADLQSLIDATRAERAVGGV